MSKSFVEKGQETTQNIFQNNKVKDRSLSFMNETNNTHQEKKPKKKSSKAKPVSAVGSYSATVRA